VLVYILALDSHSIVSNTQTFWAATYVLVSHLLFSWADWAGLARRWACAWRLRASAGRPRVRRRRKMRKVIAFDVHSSLDTIHDPVIWSLGLSINFMSFILVVSSSPSGHWHHREPPRPVWCDSEGLVSMSSPMQSFSSYSRSIYLICPHWTIQYNENRILIKTHVNKLN